MAYAGKFFMGAACSIPITLYQPPQVFVDGLACNTSIWGWAYSPEYPDYWINVDLYIDGNKYGTYPANQPRPDVNAIGIPGDHGFSIPIPSQYQDGNDHTFRVVGVDSWGVQDGSSATYTMTGCGRFHLQPDASNGRYSPNKEDPTSYSGSTSVTATYGNGWGGPASGVPATARTWYTRDGTTVSGPDAYPWSRFINRTYNPPAQAVAPGFVAGTEYCLWIDIHDTDGFIDRNGTVLESSGTLDDRTCEKVVNEPFFKTHNGNIQSGGEFSAVDSSCSGGGTLGGWHNNTSGGYNFGSSSQLTSLGIGRITGVASNQYNPANSPTGLSFANTNPADISTDADSPNLGGNYGGSACLTATDPPIVATGFTKNVSGNYTLSAADFPQALGENKSVFVDGNVYIGAGLSELRYPGEAGGWVYDTTFGTTNVPSFVLKATGNIYIDPAVTTLDGIYIAQKRPDGTGGNVYTCANGFSPVSANSQYDACYRQLVIRGSVVANKVKSMRTYGSLRDEKPVVPPAATAPAASPNGLSWLVAGPNYTSSTTNKPGDEGEVTYVSGGVSMRCTLIAESGDPIWPYGGTAMANGWNDNYICVPASSPVHLRYTYGGSTSWNTFAESRANCGSSSPECVSLSGLKAAGYSHCYSLSAIAAQEQDPVWGDNYLCSDTDIKLSFVVGSCPAGSFATRMHEDGDSEAMWKAAGGTVNICEDYTTATSLAIYGKDYTGPCSSSCTTTGNSMYSYYGINATYDINNATAGTYKLTLNYQNQNNVFGVSAAWPPPNGGNYKYNINITDATNGQSLVSNWGIGYGSGAQTASTTLSLPANAKITITWNNNCWIVANGDENSPCLGSGGSYDPNLQIDSLSFDLTSAAPPPPITTAAQCSNSRGLVPRVGTCAAEVFRFSPEMYLSQPAIRKDNYDAQQYDAITGLPPVL